jgi:hypothetical protein
MSGKGAPPSARTPLRPPASRIGGLVARLAAGACNGFLFQISPVDVARSAAKSSTSHPRSLFGRGSAFSQEPRPSYPCGHVGSPAFFIFQRMPTQIPPNPKARLIAEQTRRAAETLRRQLLAVPGRSIEDILETRRTLEQMQKDAEAFRRRHAGRQESPGRYHGKICVAGRVRVAWPGEAMELSLGTF